MEEAPKDVVLDTDALIRLGGIYDPQATKELILRDEKISAIEEQCAMNLSTLEILSLSHNHLTTLSNFQYFVNLSELNLNFNSITSLQNLQCLGLKRLYLANNKLMDISILRQFQRLNTLSLYGNELRDLDASLHTCRNLPKLRSLDLGGNPCARATGYKFQVIRQLPRLKELDGETITTLDKELSDEYMANLDISSGSSSGLQRPFTAPAGRRPSFGLGLGLEQTTPSQEKKKFDAFASKEMPRGNVRLFRDDFLNNNPILLEYLVEDAHNTSPLDAESVVTQVRDKFDGNTKSFVEKMRTANPAPESTSAGTTANKQIDRSSSNPPPIPMPIPVSSTIHATVDPSDPKTTIRKLLKHIETLTEAIAAYKELSIDGVTNESLLAENQRLQIENNNIPILQDEIIQLKKKLYKTTTTLSHSSVNETLSNRVTSLEKENLVLKKEIHRLQDILDTHEKNPEQAQAKIKKAQLLEESASIDLELTELILQNEVSLQLIRNEIKNTKLEMELKAQRAQEDLIRPMTALGICPTTRQTLSSSRSDASLDESRKRLHTSAGIRPSDSSSSKIEFFSSSNRPPVQQPKSKPGSPRGTSNTFNTSNTSSFVDVDSSSSSSHPSLTSSETNVLVL